MLMLKKCMLLLSIYTAKELCCCMQAQAQECVLEERLMEWGKDGVITNTRLAREAAMVSLCLYCTL